MKNLLIFLICFLSTVFVYSQITFEKTYGGNGYSQGFSVMQTSDSGYALTGNKGSEAYLIRTDKNGDTLWTKTFGGIGNDYGYSIVQTNDDGFIIAGNAYNCPTAPSQVYLIRTDSNGDSLWTKFIGKDGNYNYSNSVIQCHDSGYIIAGSSSISQYGSSAFYFIRTYANGDTIWTKTLYGSYSAYGYHVIQANDSGYVVVGRRGSNVCLIKTDTNGDTLWTKSYGNSWDEYGSSVANTNDGGYIIAGTIGIYGAGYNIYLIRTDSNGDTLWTKNFGGVDADFGYSVVRTSDDGFIISGETESFGAGSKDVYLIRTDSNGGALWTKTFGGINYDISRCVDQTSDGGYIIVGSTESFDANWRKVYLIKTDANGQVLGVDDYSLSMNTRISVYPNPSTGQVNIQIPQQFGQSKTLEVFNYIAQKQFEKSNDFTDIDISSLPSGLYFIVLANDKNERQIIKIIKE